MQAAYLPVVSGKVSDADAVAFGAPDGQSAEAGLRLLPHRHAVGDALVAVGGGRGRPLPEILAATKAAGYDMTGVARRIANGGRTPTDRSMPRMTSSSSAAAPPASRVAASLKARKPDLDIAIIDPADIHYYQPGWTMVGGGIFDPQTTAKTMASLIPAGVHWIKAAVAAFEPQNERRHSRWLPGGQVRRAGRRPGPEAELGGHRGADRDAWPQWRHLELPLRPRALHLGTGAGAASGRRAVFTQPPMPIKCAGAPQKALYLSADHWLRDGPCSRTSRSTSTTPAPCCSA